MKSEISVAAESVKATPDMAFEGGASSDDKGPHQASGFITVHSGYEPGQA
jgi:hypothetical protein